MKDLLWVGSSLDDLKEFSEDLRAAFGFALYQVQNGEKPQLGFKPLKGDQLTGAYELIADEGGDTFRVAYVAKLPAGVFVLHCFKKKSKTGSETPKRDINLIASRLKAARLESDAIASKKTSTQKKKD